ncbi:hypothetical protein F-VV10_0188 [Faustovirus]|nr:hypothetical protein F-VV10_0188 [Faustovirus]
MENLETILSSTLSVLVATDPKESSSYKDPLKGTFQTAYHFDLLNGTLCEYKTQCECVKEAQIDLSAGLKFTGVGLRLPMTEPEYKYFVKEKKVIMSPEVKFTGPTRVLDQFLVHYQDGKGNSVKLQRLKPDSSLLSSTEISVHINKDISFKIYPYITTPIELARTCLDIYNKVIMPENTLKWN